jgi:hypothetical protein
VAKIQNSGLQSARLLNLFDFSLRVSVILFPISFWYKQVAILL